MEIAVNINKKLWEIIQSEYDSTGTNLKEQKDKSKEVIKSILMSHSQELINVKAIDQIHRRLVIEELRRSNPKTKKELDSLDIAIKESNKFHASQVRKNMKIRGKNKSTKKFDEFSKSRVLVRW